MSKYLKIAKGKPKNNQEILLLLLLGSVLAGGIDFYMSNLQANVLVNISGLASIRHSHLLISSSNEVNIGNRSKYLKIAESKSKNFGQNRAVMDQLESF